MKNQKNILKERTTAKQNRENFEKMMKECYGSWKDMPEEEYEKIKEGIRKMREK